MEYEVTREIYYAWRGYMEVAGKLRVLKLVPPESFLPYPARTLKTALETWASYLGRDGEIEQAIAVRQSIDDYLQPYLGDKPLSDKDALEGMARSLSATIQDEQQRQDILLALAGAQQKWIAFRDVRASSRR
jgi:hypothetical protein